MISYNRKIWFSYIFRIHRADTIRQLSPVMIMLAIYSGIIAYLEMDYFKLPATSYVSNLSVIHGLLGFVISLMLAYRINSAYDRWWEGRVL